MSILQGSLSYLDDKIAELNGILSDSGNEHLAGTLSESDDSSLQLFGALSESDESSLQGTLSSTFLRGLSAYQEAVLNGFHGTRKEWIESLQGRKVLLRENNNTIEWKYDIDTEWKFLISLEPTRDYSVLVNKPTLNGKLLDGEVLSNVNNVISTYVDSRDFSEKLTMTNAEIEQLLQ